MIRNSKCDINVKNKDQLCFKYVVLAGLFEASGGIHGYRVSPYDYTEIIEDVSEISMLKSSVVFDKKNDLSVNLYCVEKFENCFDFYLFSNKQ